MLTLDSPLYLWMQTKSKAKNKITTTSCNPTHMSPLEREIKQKFVLYG